MPNSNCPAKHYGEPPAITVDVVVLDSDQLCHTLAIWKDACLTVDRLSGLVRTQWPGAIETMHHYGVGIRLRFRSDLDETLFTGVILGAWERANDFDGTVEVISM